ncbi:MAG TPA: hypothetical protein VGG73_17400 [Vicinamibacterales bacterium]
MTRDYVAPAIGCSLWLGLSAVMFAQVGGFDYDRSAEETVSGKIVTLVAMPAADSNVGVHLDFSTTSSMVNVHLGPAKYIGDQNFWFNAGDEVTMVGVKAFIDGNKSFIVRTITKDGRTLTLRTSDGKPAWTPAVEGVDGCGVMHPVLPRGTEM